MTIIEKQLRQENDKDNFEGKKYVNRIVLAGGGTGGHIYPAIGIAQALQRLNPEVDLVFIGGDDRLESTLVPQQGYQFLPIKVEGFPRSFTLKWIPVIIKVIKGLLQSIKHLKRFKPEVVIGTGGYVSGPVLFAGWLLDIPITIQEQNVTPGLTNSILSCFAKAAFLALPPKTHRFPENIIQITGNPIRPEITECSRTDEIYSKYSLDPNLTTVFVMGGSQGARAINSAMINASPLIAERVKNIQQNKDNGHFMSIIGAKTKQIQIVHQTGESDVEDVKEAYSKHGIPHHTRPFFNQVEEVYCIADLMICRAGGMTVSEVTACGIPAIFIPLPAAIGNNQVQNAETVVNAGAATMLEQDTLKHDVLVNEFFRIITDTETFQEMRSSSLSLGRPFAGDMIAKSIYELTLVK